MPPHVPRPAAYRLVLLAVAATAASGVTAAEGEQAGPRTLFLIGDSTVKNGSGRGDGGLWGWGQVLQPHFDREQVIVENRALGGRSSRTYLTEGLWERTLEKIKPGDVVLMQFGHNDGGQMFASNRPRASIRGNGDETQDGVVEQTGKAETVHSYGWYLRKYIADAQAKGATPVVLSPVPRDRWKDGKLVRADGDYGRWAREAAEQAGAAFVDLNALVADRYDELGQEAVHAELFTPTDHTHTNRRGAEVNAECVAAGVRSLSDSPLRAALLPPPGQEYRFDFGAEQATDGFVAITNAQPYAADPGFGFEPGADVTLSGADGGQAASEEPFAFSVRLPEGNHLVRVTLGAAEGGSATRVEAELRRRLIDDVVTQGGDTATREFLVNTRTPALPHGRWVRLKEREKTSEVAAWDHKLTLRFAGERPSVKRLEVLPAADAPTLFLLGDSTVADQYKEPWASWGQKLPRLFDSTLAVANHAESGETLGGAWGAGRCDKVLHLLRPGDFVMAQFGHNDMKSKRPDALERYRRDLVKLVQAVRERGGQPILVTSMERKAGLDKDTLGEYPQTVRDVAAEMNAPLIDLHATSKQLYQDLDDRLDSAFQDGTHHTNFGAELLAALVADGVRQSAPDLAAHLSDAPPVRP
ncbi:Rhamnogalacturonan acetylesterase RhgT [Posidoniimonas corsicana]|uniref:Rhamnogalacturonan acetylesterase RhgT n=1 Tax=Posidoniimonas corsicana TaxID=1938618 RepID=A0A5C5VID0_9BACT|nr:rhamnogalacturonan acetylesterase [Posidoniimonas corsicana]TWT37629.1 Rhamnogalacturonan acetylesterase RhgT [Posidoniimonas corsicana]